MLGKKLFDEISNSLGETLEKSPVKDVEKNIKAVLGSAFSRMDLVTREEFDIQQQVLLKTREKLAALEARVAELENLLNIGNKNTAETAEENAEAETPSDSHNAA